MPTPMYYTLDDIAARWDVTRRTVERRINDPNDPHPLIARKFGGSVRVRRDNLLTYEEQHIQIRTPRTGKPQRKSGKPHKHDAISA